jgi:hypothetical protein
MTGPSTQEMRTNRAHEVQTLLSDNGRRIWNFSDYAKGKNQHWMALDCYAINGVQVILQRSYEGVDVVAWEVFAPLCVSNNADATHAAVEQLIKEYTA